MTRRFAEVMSVVLVAALLVVVGCALAGCQTEQSRENDRIKAKIENEIPTNAVKMIQQKYGFEAEVVTVEPQGDSQLFSYKNSPFVYVAMRHADRVFAALLNVDDSAVFFDNYQAPEIIAALDNYFAQVQGLPAPYASNTTFTCKGFSPRANRPDTIGANQDEGENAPADGEEILCDARNLVNFTYSGQSAQELLQNIETLNFENSYVGAGVELEGLSFDASTGDWPSDGSLDLSMSLTTFDSEDDVCSASDRAFYTRWWERGASLRVATLKTSGHPVSAYTKSSTATVGECTIVGKSGVNIEESVTADSATPSWNVGEVQGLASGKKPDALYQATPLFSVSAQAQSAADAVARQQDSALFFDGLFYLVVPQQSRAEDGSYFVGLYYPDTGATKVKFCNAEAHPSNEPQAVALYAAEGSNDRQVCYAILQPEKG